MGVHTNHLGPQCRDPELRGRLQRESGGDSNTALLLYAGRLSREKNLALLVEMMEQLMSPALLNSSHRRNGASPECRLLVAGSGPLEGWLREQGERLGGRLHLVGHLTSREQLARLLASVEVFVHPNPREPFGIGPLEAMTSGTPLIAPEQGGVLEYADQSCAWLAKPEGKTFACAVRDILSNPAEVRTKVEKARLVAERHDWLQVAPRFFETYEAFHAARRGAQGRFGA
jgi:alpha-1,6-mannosyltransferase